MGNLNCGCRKDYKNDEYDIGAYNVKLFITFLEKRNQRRKSAKVDNYKRFKYINCKPKTFESRTKNFV